MGLAGAIAIFVISWIVGTIGIYAGAHLVVDQDVGYVSAAITALLGALVYAVLGFFAWIPVIGPLLLLVLWIGVINLRHRGGWVNAAGIGLVAWVVALVIIYLLATFSGGAFDINAFGIPGI